MSGPARDGGAEDPRVAPPREVANALLTPFDRGPLRSEKGPYRWMVGAVYGEDGGLIPESQKTWHGLAHAPLAADPLVVAVPDRARSFAGVWLYAGHWTNHFGHFLLETLTNLWFPPTDFPERIDGVIAHRGARGPVPEPGRHPPARPPRLAAWQTDLLRLAGYADRPLIAVHGRAVRVERLLVPTRPVLLKRWAQPSAVAAWRRVSDAVGRRGDDERVYLSRSRFHTGAANQDRVRSDPHWDSRLDETFTRAGFRIVHPQTLSIEDQIAAVRGARVLAGPSGSALHLSVFAAAGTRVLAVGDRREPDEPSRTQQVVDRACGHESQFAAYEDSSALARYLDLD